MNQGAVVTWMAVVYRYQEINIVHEPWGRINMGWQSCISSRKPMLFMTPGFVDFISNGSTIIWPQHSTDRNLTYTPVLSGVAALRHTGA